MRSDADRLDVRRPRLGEDRGQLLEIPLVDAGLASYVVADKSKSDNAIAGACLLARKTPSEAGKVVAMPKRQAVSPRTLNRLRPRGRVEALRAEPRDSLYAGVGWVSARRRFA